MLNLYSSHCPGTNDRQLMANFLNGLDAVLRREVLKLRPNNFAEAREHASRLFNLGYPSINTMTVPTVPQTQTSIPAASMDLDALRLHSYST